MILEAEILNLLRRLTKWNRLTFTTSDYFEVPAGVRLLFITAIGGGGGGAGAMGGVVVGHPTQRSSAGGGGGAGGYVIGFPFKVPYGFTRLPFVIGSGGSGATGRNTSGSNGGDTIFCNSIIAPGGYGADYDTATRSDTFTYFMSNGGSGGGIKFYQTSSGVLDTTYAAGSSPGEAGKTTHIDGYDGTYSEYLPFLLGSAASRTQLPDGATFVAGSGAGGGGYYWDDGSTLYVDDMGDGGNSGPSQILDQVYQVAGQGGASDKINGWAGGGAGASSPFGVGGSGGYKDHPAGYAPVSAEAYGAGGGGAAAPPTDSEETTGGNGRPGWLMVEWMG